MKMSVSTRMSGTVPLVATGDRGSRVSAERRSQDRSGIGFGLEVRVESASNHLSERDAFSLRHFVDQPPLRFGQVHLRSNGNHTARLYSMTAAQAARRRRRMRSRLVGALEYAASTSLRASLMRLMPSTATAMASPGKIDIHQATRRNRWALLTR